MAALADSPVGELRSLLERITADPTLEPNERVARLRDFRNDLADLLGQVETYLGENELARESGSVMRELARQAARENADVREEMVRRGIATDEQLDGLGMHSHAQLDAMESDGTLGEHLEEAFGLGALHGDTFNSKVKRDHGQFSTMNVAGGPPPAKPRGAPRRRVSKPAPAATAPASPSGPAKASQRIGMGADAPRSDAVPPTPELTGDALRAHVEQLGLNRWPEPGPAAIAALGGSRSTRDHFTVPLAASPGSQGGDGRAYSLDRKPVHDAVIGHFVGEAVGKVLGPEHPITRKLSVGKPLTPEEETTVRDAATARRGGGPPQALFMAGGGGSGKSTVLGNSPELSPDAAVSINPDDIKEHLPEYKQMREAGDPYAATGVHSESNDLGRTLEDHAQRMGLNMVVDGTGDHGPGHFAAGIQQAKDEGYEPSVIYVTAPTDIAVERAVQRAMKTGRWVPEPVLRKAHARVSANFGEIAKLPYLKGLKVFDTRNDKPTLVFDGKRAADVSLFREFIGKKGEEHDA